jgi:imidazole glycerol-phosphate synthase subunit HisF
VAAVIPRVIPCLLLQNRGLVKTVRFKDPVYVGDPINAVKIFNDKEVDELIFLDITASAEKRRPAFDYLKDVASESFMPFGYGGGIRSVDDIKTILGSGIEKVSINAYALENPNFIREAADRFGSQSIVVSIDVKKNLLDRYEIYAARGQKRTRLDPVKFAAEAAGLGAGEILLNSIDRDGRMNGYDLELIRRVSSEVDVPVIACGGAGSVQDLVDAVKKGGASASAAGSLFVFHGRHRAVLINYPAYADLKAAFNA